MIHIEVKHDRDHKVYRRLSIGFHNLCAISVIKDSAWSYVLDYAKNNQMNPDMIAFRAVDESGKIVYNQVSKATENRPTRINHG